MIACVIWHVGKVYRLTETDLSSHENRHRWAYNEINARHGLISDCIETEREYTARICVSIYVVSSEIIAYYSTHNKRSNVNYIQHCKSYANIS